MNAVLGASSTPRANVNASESVTAPSASVMRAGTPRFRSATTSVGVTSNCCARSRIHASTTAASSRREASSTSSARTGALAAARMLRVASACARRVERSAAGSADGGETSR